jgi:hypothetical protein
MESLEYNLNEGIALSDNTNKIFLSISILSWLTFLVTSWLSLGLPYNFNFARIFWLTTSINVEKNKDYYHTSYNYIPIAILYEFHYAVFIFAFSIATIGFLIFMVFRENENVINLMFGKFSRFHFIPLFSISALCIIGETLNFYDVGKHKDPFNESKFIFNFAFTIIGLVSLILISFTTKIKKPWYAFLSINKGTYSCLISLLVYNLFFSILSYVNFKSDETDEDWVKGSGIAFSLIIGIINTILSFVLKDIMIAFTNALIYTGMLIYFFKIDKEIRDNYNGNADGIIDIVILAGNLGVIIFLALNWKSIYKDN